MNRWRFFCTEQYEQRDKKKNTPYTVHICSDDSEILKSSICEFATASLQKEGLCCAENRIPSGAELQVWNGDVMPP